MVSEWCQVYDVHKKWKNCIDVLEGLAVAQLLAVQWRILRTFYGLGSKEKRELGYKEKAEISQIKI